MVIAFRSARSTQAGCVYLPDGTEVCSANPTATPTPTPVPPTPTVTCSFLPTGDYYCTGDPTPTPFPTYTASPTPEPPSGCVYLFNGDLVCNPTPTPEAEATNTPRAYGYQYTQAYSYQYSVPPPPTNTPPPNCTYLPNGDLMCPGDSTPTSQHPGLQCRRLRRYADTQAHGTADSDAYADTQAHRTADSYSYSNTQAHGTADSYSYSNTHAHAGAGRMPNNVHRRDSLQQQHVPVLGDVHLGASVRQQGVTRFTGLPSSCRTSRRRTGIAREASERTPTGTT